MVMKGSLTATSSTSSLFKATLATKRPILPNPVSYTGKIIINSQKSDLCRNEERSEELEYLPLIPILILAAPREIQKKSNTKEKSDQTRLIEVKNKRENEEK